MTVQCISLAVTFSSYTPTLDWLLDPEEYPKSVHVLPHSPINVLAQWVLLVLVSHLIDASAVTLLRAGRSSVRMRYKARYSRRSMGWWVMMPLNRSRI